MRVVLCPPGPVVSCPTAVTIRAGDIDLDGDGEISFDEFRQMMEEDTTTTATTTTPNAVCASPPSAAGTGA